MIAFTENGGVNGQILKAIFKRIDDLGLYLDERAQGLTPFALIDGHQSRFDLDFLKYINAEDTHWNVCIGVPYGTSLWQIGDSAQQNGRFKMLLTEKKKRNVSATIKYFPAKTSFDEDGYCPTCKFNLAPSIW